MSQGTSVKEEKTVTNPIIKSGKRKWLGRIGKFLMYGGWMVILVIVVAVLIAIQALTK